MKTDVSEFKISKDDAIKYLSIYVGDADWGTNIDRLYERLSKKFGKDEAIPMMRKALCCTILLPTYDRTSVPDVPENLLHWVPSYHQFNDRDWVQLMKGVVAKDQEIAGWRGQCQSLGVVHPLEFSPITRQAMNWLVEAAREAGAVSDENKASVKKVFERLVMTYGGKVVCNIFEDHRSKVRKKVINWKTNYFFERLIFDIYTPEQVYAIKQNELNKTNPTLVKKIK